MIKLTIFTVDKTVVFSRTYPSVERVKKVVSRWIKRCNLIALEADLLDDYIA